MAIEGPGPQVRPGGVSFRLLSQNASGVSLCLFDEGGEVERLELERGIDGTWEIEVPGVGPGQLYGYRVEGPHRPGEGHRFNPAKLLMDPRAGAIHGRVRWSEALVGTPVAAGPDARADGRDSAAYQARSVVVDPTFDWRGDRRPQAPWGETVLYEAHVRGLTRLHPDLPPERRGTYLGLASPPVVEHLRSLGVTTIELMPVQHFVSERHLLESGRKNYWGYSPMAWFAPHAGYSVAGFEARGEQVAEFKTMVRELHRAGLEVVLDMVFNHTAEGGENGPTLSLRGVDNALYYLLDEKDPRRYLDFTGCGNTVDAGQPEVAALILDCLRYWVEVFHVDGFRFDLATTLGRENGEFSGQATLLEAISADRVLSEVKLIAEPWDLGPSGYRLGSFPPGWAGWNDRFRDTVRSFWRGDPGTRADLATRLAGSSDLLAKKRRGPLGGINYITCHDGFTLEDLVSYDRKHNLANLEDDRDGRNENLSRNWGAEGLTDSEEVRSLRDRVKRSLLATLAFSFGVPMLSHGDELGRSQGGNNNAYCQDGRLSWVDWSLNSRKQGLLDFVRRLFCLRKELEVFDSDRFPTPDELSWLGADGRVLETADWQDEGDRVLGVRSVMPSGAELLGWFNGSDRDVGLTLPPSESGWLLVLDTATGERPFVAQPAPAEVLLSAHSVLLLVAAR